MIRCTRVSLLVLFRWWGCTLGADLWAVFALVLCCVAFTWMFLPKPFCCFQSADRSAETQMIVRSDDSNKQLCSINFHGVS